MHYTGRFAPSPTGPLHAGSLVAALASWLDARAHRGRWLVRIEDIDTPRCVPGAAELILAQLAALHLLPDEPPLHQSSRHDAYAAALGRLVDAGAAYPCACTRKEIDDAWVAAGVAHARHAERVYPGTCRHGLRGRPARAMRFLTTTPAQAAPTAVASGPSSDCDDPPVVWVDRRLGSQSQQTSRAVGDFVLRRADGLWAYQLAVVVDDAAQGVSDVVRGEDLADNTARQILLQNALGLATPRYLHTPLVLAADGQKLSKQNGAAALDTSDPLSALRAAGVPLGLRLDATTALDWLAQAVAAWRKRWAAPQQPT